MKQSKLKKTPRPKKKKKTKKGATPFKVYSSLGSTPTISEEKSKELAARLDSVSSKHKRNRTRMTQLGKVLKKKGKKKKGLTRGGGKTRGGRKSRRKKYSKRNR